MPNAPSSSPNGEILYPKEIMTPPGGQESFGGVPISPEVPEGYEVDPDAEETAIDIMEAVETGGSEDARAIDELLRDPQERAELVQAIETDPEVQNVLTRGFAGAKELVRKTLNTLKYAPYHLHASLILGLYSLGAASTGNAGPISWEAAGNVSGTPIPTPVSIPSATGPTGGAG
ncbi:hypothetical protein HZA38_01970, partial [Candidatus Peregrinibacteria bacterium]|nr:hypothetical protein [Candidatus Peregrinibacteria bacterium]